MLAYSPMDRLVRIRQQVTPGLPQVQVIDESGGEGGNGGSGSEPSSHTFRNLAIGGGVAVAPYLAYSFLAPPKRAAPVAGLPDLFKRRRKRRARRVK